MGIEIGVSSLSMADRIEFLRTLASWLTSGSGRMPVADSIRNTCEAFSRDEYRGLANRMSRITSDYNSGQVTFSASLRAAKIGFSDQELAMLDAAERSNQLRGTVPEMVEAMEMRLNSTRSLYRRLAMPVVGGFMLIVMSLGVAMFMLPLVLGPVLERKPEALFKFPMIVRGFWYFSQWLQAGWPVALIILAIPPTLFLTRNTKVMQPFIEKIVWNFPPLRRISVAFNGVLVVYLMPALVRSGMPMHDVLRAVAASLENQTIASNFRIAANEHESGLRLGDALARVPLRGAFRSAVEAGEKTGQIAERVQDLKKPFAAEYDRIIRRAVATLMTIVMAGLLPLFIISMYTSLVAPIFALMEF